MIVEVSKSTPFSGLYDEVIFSNSSELLSFEFNDEEGDVWIGKVKRGWKSNCKIFVVEEFNLAVLFAGGITSVINYKMKSLCYCIDMDECDDCIYDINTNQIIISDGLSIELYAIKTGDVNYKTDRISWDGVSFKNIKNNILHGWLNDLSDNGAEFKFDLKTYKLDADYYININQVEPSGLLYRALEFARKLLSIIKRVIR